MKTIQEILKEKGFSKYRLSKESGIPWATLSDICSGKTDIEKCSAGTLNKLAKTLNIPMEELILAKGEPDTRYGLPENIDYLEKNLPPSIQKAITDYVKGKQDNVSYLDCLWGELYGAINASQWDSSITLEQADYLRQKYLYGGAEEKYD